MLYECKQANERAMSIIIVSCTFSQLVVLEKIRLESKKEEMESNMRGFENYFQITYHSPKPFQHIICLLSACDKAKNVYIICVVCQSFISDNHYLVGIVLGFWKSIN